MIKQFLDDKAKYYNQKWFIANDPVSIPHNFQKKEDIEISAFITASIAWGQRKMIIKKASSLMNIMENSPYNFLLNADENQLSTLNHFVYRTFNGIDCSYFISALKEIYQNHGGLEKVFVKGYQKQNTVFSALLHFREVFMSFAPLPRTGKHVASVKKGATAKRLNMFLRWMVRDDGIVDFGLWKNIPKSALMIPLDVHVGRIARKTGLLHRKQDNWKAVEELTAALRKFNPHDPVYYDYALFGTGVFEKNETLPHFGK